nr:unnamed protein product [Callosobruchus chinensis]
MKKEMMIYSMKISSSDWNIVKPKPSKGKEKQAVANKISSTEEATIMTMVMTFLEDFMAGLDVVDEDEEVDEKSVSENAEKQEVRVPVKSRLGIRPIKNQKQKML